MWPVDSYEVEDVIDEYEMNDSYVYKTSKRCYINKNNPSKLPDVGSIMSYACINFKADDGYGPTEIYHVKVIEHLSDDKIKGIPVDRQSLKCEDTYSLKADRWYIPIYEE